MKRISLLILFFSLLSIGNSQTVILGTLGQNRSDFFDPTPGFEVYIDSIFKSFSDLDGMFTISIPENYNIDTLRFKANIFYDFAIINLPKDRDTINLDTISCFEYSYDFYADCFELQIIYDYKPKKRHKKKMKFMKSEEEYYTEREKMIKDYKYEYEGRKYSIDLKCNCIDLNKNNN